MNNVLFLILPLLNWSLKLVLVISLLSFFSEPEPSLNSEISEIHFEPKVQLLNSQICVKSHRLQFSTEKLTEIKKAISSLEIKSGQIQLKYNELLRQLKNDLLRNESECRSLHSQIFEMAKKRHKVLSELQYHLKNQATLSF